MICCKMSVTCTICNRSMPSYMSLQYHLHIFHEQSTMDCDKCEEKFETMKNLAQHYEEHTAENEQSLAAINLIFTCHFCNETNFSNEGEIISHITAAHLNTTLKPEESATKHSNKNNNDKKPRLNKRKRLADNRSRLKNEKKLVTIDILSSENEEMDEPENNATYTESSDEDMPLQSLIEKSDEPVKSETDNVSIGSSDDEKPLQSLIEKTVEHDTSQSQNKINVHKFNDFVSILDDCELVLQHNNYEDESNSPVISNDNPPDEIQSKHNKEPQSSNYSTIENPQPGPSSRNTVHQKLVDSVTNVPSINSPLKSLQNVAIVQPRGAMDFEAEIDSQVDKASIIVIDDKTPNTNLKTKEALAKYAINVQYLYGCSICKINFFQDLKSLSVHAVSSHKGPNDTCDVCGLTVIKDYVIHRFTHDFKYTEMVLFTCKICKLMYVGIKAFDNHLNTDHPNSQIMQGTEGGIKIASVCSIGQSKEPPSTKPIKILSVSEINGTTGANLTRTEDVAELKNDDIVNLDDLDIDESTNQMTFKILKVCSIFDKPKFGKRGRSRLNSPKPIQPKESLLKLNTISNTAKRLEVLPKLTPIVPEVVPKLINKVSSTKGMEILPKSTTSVPKLVTIANTPKGQEDIPKLVTIANTPKKPGDVPKISFVTSTSQETALPTLVTIASTPKGPGDVPKISFVTSTSQETALPKLTYISNTSSVPEVIPKLTYLAKTQNRPITQEILVDSDDDDVTICDAVIETEHEEYECFFCLKHFQKLNQIQWHIRNGHLTSQLCFVPKFPKAITKFKCIMCKNVQGAKPIADMPALLDHLISHSTNGKCVECDVRWDTRTAIMHHLKTHNLDKYKTLVYQCPYCNKKFIYRLTAELHCRSHQKDGNEYACDNCKLIFNDFGNLISHRKNVHGKTVKNEQFKCYFCDFSNFSRGIVMQHIIHTHKESSIWQSCCFCDFADDSSDAMKKHILEVHQNDPNALESYGNIQKSKEKKKKLACVFCNKEFSSADLKLHVVLHHLKKDVANANVLCVACQSSLPNIYHLRLHNQCQHPIGLLHCIFCKLLFETPHERKSHELTVHNLSPSCYKCTKVLPSESDLIHHYISEHYKITSFNPIHVYISPSSEFITEIVKEDPVKKEILIQYQCRICQSFHSYKKFALEHHIHSEHANETQNEKSCPFCPLKTKNLDRMTEHVIMQHLKTSEMPSITNEVEEVFSEMCLYCDKKFENRRVLQQHVVNKHFKVGMNTIPMRCNICDIKMENLFYLQLHKEIMHPNGYENLVCLNCNLIFPNEPTRLKHDEQHVYEKLVKCFKCAFTADHEVKLVSHYLQSHVSKDNMEMIYTYPSTSNSNVMETVKQNSQTKQTYIEYYCTHCKVPLPYIITKVIGHVCK